MKVFIEIYNCNECHNSDCGMCIEMPSVNINLPFRELSCDRDIPKWCPKAIV